MPVALIDAYKDVLSLFNKPDYTALLRVMDPDIVVKRVLKPGSIVGIGDVESYLIRHMLPLRPKFDIVGVPTFHPQPPADKAAMDARVSGTGDYYDDTIKTSPTPTRVLFIWTFTRTDTTQEWLLINAFGAPTS